MRTFILSIFLIAIFSQPVTASDLPTPAEQTGLLSQVFENLNYLQEQYLPSEPWKQNVLLCVAGLSIYLVNNLPDLNAPIETIYDKHDVTLIPNWVNCISSYIFSKGAHGILHSVKEKYLTNTVLISKNKKTKKNNENYLRYLRPKIDMFSIAMIDIVSGMALLYMPALKELNDRYISLNLIISATRSVGAFYTIYGIYNFKKLKNALKHTARAPSNLDYLLTTGGPIFLGVHVSVLRPISPLQKTQILECVAKYRHSYDIATTRGYCVGLSFAQREIDGRPFRVLALGAFFVYVFPVFYDIGKKTYDLMRYKHPLMEPLILDEIEAAAIFEQPTNNLPNNEENDNMLVPCLAFYDSDKAEQSSETQLLQKQAWENIQKSDEKKRKKQQRAKRENHLFPDEMQGIVVAIPAPVQQQNNKFSQLEAEFHAIKGKKTIKKKKFKEIINGLCQSGVQTYGKSTSGNQTLAYNGIMVGFHPIHGKDNRIDPGRIKVLWAIWQALNAEHGHNP